MTGKLNILQRLHAVMHDVDYVQKEKKAGMNYSIVSHDAVTAKVRPILVKHGIVYYPVSMARHQEGNRTEVDLTLRFVNIDEPADFIDVVGCGYGVDPQDKGPGKAISYAVKYCLLKALGLETGDDPDETQDEKANHKPAPDLKALAEKIIRGINAAPYVDALDSTMDITMVERQMLPAVTQQHIDKVYTLKREQLENAK